MFIFINGILVVDLGGVHQRLPGKVIVTGATGTATIIEGGSLDATGTNILPCPAARIRTRAWHEPPTATTATVT